MFQLIYLELQILVVPCWADGDDYIHTEKSPCEECEKNEDKHGLYDVIWLASTNDIDENVKFIEKLRGIVLRLKTFNDADRCQVYIDQLSAESQLIMIISDVKHIEIIRHIYHLRRISSIYICSTEIITKQQWMSYCPKIKGIFDDFNELITRVEKDQDTQRKLEEPLGIHLLSIIDYRDKSTSWDGEFVYTQSLLNCILSIPSNEQDKNELISICKYEYSDSPGELRNIDDFDKYCSSKNILWWYTRECFFQKILNRVLRQQNIHMTFLLRRYINDLREALFKIQSTIPLKVYRSQLMSKSELDCLLNQVDKYICINSFFSTSLERYIASFRMGHGDPQNDLVKVLFEIDAYPNLKNETPFANISSDSKFDNEIEVLFTVGSIFRLNAINCNEDHVYTIKMTLCSTEEHELKPVLDYIKSKNRMQQKNLHTFAKFLLNMGKFDYAAECCQRFMHQLSSDDPDLIDVYEDLAVIASQTGDFNQSLQWQKKLLSLRQTIPNVVKVNNSERTHHSNDSAQSSTARVRECRNYPSGDAYDGEFLNDLYHGYGIYTWENGDRYEGMWEHNRREGQGTWTWGAQTASADDQYCGEWHADKKHGYGEYFQKNGDIYKGQFKDDKRDGMGIYQMKNGQCFNVVYDRDHLISRENI
ncbi:unnamed protein product [Adineta ricciae]|uniref:Uncharacterized protein n=1 Tax=Adineta ricciae TaxID=249248 RepID=A0A814L309_ADIRI|nr:unnamed protein product [Adineta ricciae]CAF1058092.1 unnamed protein product [Adineta ricciae]